MRVEAFEIRQALAPVAYQVEVKVNIVCIIACFIWLDSLNFMPHNSVYIHGKSAKPIKAKTNFLSCCVSRAVRAGGLC